MHFVVFLPHVFPGDAVILCGSGGQYRNPDTAHNSAKGVTNMSRTTFERGIAGMIQAQAGFDAANAVRAEALIPVYGQELEAIALMVEGSQEMTPKAVRAACVATWKPTKGKKLSALIGNVGKHYKEQRGCAADLIAAIRGDEITTRGQLSAMVTPVDHAQRLANALVKCHKVAGNCTSVQVAKAWRIADAIIAELNE